MSQTVTAGPAERKAARLLEQADQLEQESDRLTEGLRRQWEREEERLRRDPDLNREAVARLANERYEPLKQKMAEARADYNKRRAELIREARAACFGRAPTNPEKLVAWRDSRDRAEALGDKQIADQQMRKALNADDELLAKAIAEVAHDRGWGQLVSVRAVPVVLLGALSELERPPSKRPADIRVLPLEPVAALSLCMPDGLMRRARQAVRRARRQAPTAQDRNARRAAPPLANRRPSFAPLPAPV